MKIQCFCHALRDCPDGGWIARNPVLQQYMDASDTAERKK